MSSKTSIVTIGVSQASVKPSPLANEEGWFSKIVCTTAGSISVKGIGIMEYIALNGDWTGHIDPATGIAGVGASACAANGYYEALPVTAVVFAQTEHDEIRGMFTEFSSNAAFKGYGYAYSINASGPEYTFA